MQLMQRETLLLQIRIQILVCFLLVVVVRATSRRLIWTVRERERDKPLTRDFKWYTRKSWENTARKTIYSLEGTINLSRHSVS